MYKLFYKVLAPDPGRIRKFLLVMKLVSIFMIVGMLQVSAAGYGQSITLKHNSATLGDVFEQITAQTGYKILCNADLIQSAQARKVDFEEADIHQILHTYFPNKAFAVTLKNKTIVIEQKTIVKPPVKVIQPQPIQLTGVVTDSTTGEPLAGVSIKVKGTTTGTITDAQGKFSLEVKDGAMLEVSYLGYSSKVVPVDGKTSFDISLSATATGLNQLVVVGYGTERKKNITGSVSHISSKKFENQPISNVGAALIGQASGVQVQQPTGQPGAGFTIHILGEASINASNQPLFVIDGIPVKDITNFAPSDIASIEILKDAASTAIYGSRGSNGVVLITTKHGHKGPTQFSFNAYYGIQQITKKLDLTSGSEWINIKEQIEDSAWVQLGSRIGKDYKASDPISFRQQQLGVKQNATYIPDPRWSEPGYPGLTFVNWQDEFYREAPVQNYQLSASGGNEGLTYLISGNYLNQKGIAIATGFKRFSVRANFKAHLNNKIVFGLELNPSLSFNTGENVDGKDQQTQQVVTVTPVSERNVGDKIGVSPYLNYYWGYSGWISPVYYQELSTNIEKQSNIFSKMYLSADLFRGLNLKVVGSWIAGASEHKVYIPTKIESGNIGHSPGTLSSGSYDTGNNNKYLFETLLNYDVSLGQNNLTTVLGYSLMNTKSQGSHQSNGQFANDLLTTLNKNTSTVLGSSTSESEESLISFFGRVNYNYDEKYLAMVSLRRDGSSRFGADNKWGYFPALSLGWRISQEPFMQSLNWLSNLKLRFSWGENGNNSIPNYVSYGALGVYNYSFGGTLNVGYGPSGLSNPNLGWEKTKSSDYGIDISVLKSRIQLTADYYHKITSNLLLSVPVALSTGFSSGWENIGQVRNTGLEFALNTRPVVGALTWNSSFNISFNHNKVLHLGHGNAPIHTGFRDQTEIIEVGHPLDEYYMYDAIGVYMTPDELKNTPHMSTNIVGDVRYKDANGDGVINADDRTIVGHRFPTISWGFSNSLTWKHFDLSFIIQGQGGNKIYSILGRAIDRPGMGGLINHLGRWRNRWRSVADPGNGKVPRIDGTTGGLYDSRWLYNAEYWRLRNLTLGYTLPNDLIKGVHKLRFYISGQNLYTHDHYYGGYNPDANNNSGGDYGGYPLARTYLIGVNLKF